MQKSINQARICIRCLFILSHPINEFKNLPKYGKIKHLDHAMVGTADKYFRNDFDGFVFLFSGMRSFVDIN